MTTERLIKSNVISKEQEIQELSEIVEALQENNKELSELIGHLSAENEDLQIQYKQLKDIIPYIQCKYPPYTFAEIMHLSSHQVVKIAEKIDLFSDEKSALRISRVKKGAPRKYETLVLLSAFAFIKIFESITNAIKYPSDYSGVYKIIKSKLKLLAPLVINYEAIDSIAISNSSDKSLKKIWDNNIEDEAWRDL
ncbi:MAG: hypothetical protein AABZ39_04740 [Spirochaetota bacterium]